MSLPANNVLGDLRNLSTREVLDRIKNLSLEQIVGKSAHLPFGITLRSVKKLQQDLRDQGFPEPGERFSKWVYVAGPITPTKYCPNMQQNRERIHRAALSLFLLGYRPYCPSVPWFQDPETYNLWYFLILLMDEAVIRDSNGFYACKYSRTSTGVNFEDPVAVASKLPRFFESKSDKRHFEKMQAKKQAAQEQKAQDTKK